LVGCMVEHILRVFGNMVLSRVFGRKRVEVTGKWRRMHNEELLIRTPHQVSHKKE
jgi:hypothetical protein